MKTLRSFILVLAAALSVSADPLPIVLLPTSSEPTTPGWHQVSIAHDGLTRWMLAYVPDGLPARAPVVVLLHGGTGGMRSLFEPVAGASREWPFLADEEKFILMVPNAINPATGDPFGDQQNWNDLRPTGSDRDSNADDVGFLRKVMDRAVSAHGGDPLRIYCTGGSNGGQMTFRVAMEMAGKVAACATVVANLNESTEFYSEPARPVPMLINCGTRDPLMSFEGEAGKLLSAQATVDWWVLRNGAGPAGPEIFLPDLDPSDGSRVTRTDYAAMGSSAPVSFVKVIGGGHVASSLVHFSPSNPILNRILGIQGRDIESAQVSWDFMKAHALSLKPRLEIERDENGLLEGSFSGGYPAGEGCLLVSESLGLEANWQEVMTITLDDFGSGKFPSIVDPRVGSATRAFYRVETFPLGGSV